MRGWSRRSRLLSRVFLLQARSQTFVPSLSALLKSRRQKCTCKNPNVREDGSCLCTWPLLMADNTKICPFCKQTELEEYQLPESATLYTLQGPVTNRRVVMKHCPS